MVPKKVYYGALKVKGVYTAGLDLPGSVHLYSPQLFCFGVEMSILCLHHCIWKQIVCKVSQIHSWNRILLQDEL